MIRALRELRRSMAWPWRDKAYSGSVLSAGEGAPDTLADCCCHSPPMGLRRGAACRRRSNGGCVRPGDEPWQPGEFASHSRALRRTTLALASMRRTLLDAAALPPTVLHGDAHSGDVIVRGEHAILLDWGRAARRFTARGRQFPAAVTPVSGARRRKREQHDTDQMRSAAFSPDGSGRAER